MNPAAIEHDFRGVWKWFSCYSGMKNVAFKHENRGFRARILQFYGTNLAASRQEFGKVFALESLYDYLPCTYKRAPVLEGRAM